MILHNMVLQVVVGVSILLERDGKILIAKRADDKDYGPGLWEIPAGRVEQGEDLCRGLFERLTKSLKLRLPMPFYLMSIHFKR
ncbi:MAG: NUDIX domain-containing protein [Candidatus Heimdallarchaeota archaeon]|nr:NUDIX domain-containing protein [Candidatus Heimdallarchaeota archaeon]